MIATWKTRTAVAVLALGVVAGVLKPVLPAAAAVTAAPDVLVLDTGETLTGAVLDQVFSLRTAYGALKLERSWIAFIDFVGDPHGLQTLITVNSNRFTGFLEETTVAFQPQDLNTVVHRAVQLVKHKLEMQSIELKESLAEGLPAVDCDGNQIQQVILVLMVNASEAMPKGGTLEVTTEFDQAGEQGIVRVKDNGSGIPQDSLF